MGSGGREHALCHSFSRTSRVSQLFCADGNAGIAGIARCVPIRPDDVDGLLDFARSSEIDLTFVGGEAALELGIVDAFSSADMRIIGPTRKASRLETSKAFAKDFMARHDVPTARYFAANSIAEAIGSLNQGVFGDSRTPLVVKADGLAAGKGVVVTPDRGAAISAIESMGSLVGAKAAERIILEECLVGKEVSLLMFVNGEEFALMPPTRDHKRIGDNDTGPNTGGMGTFTDDSLLTSSQLEMIEAKIIRPTLRGCISEGMPFRGILFLGLMLTRDGPKLLEYNVRFGDPETQSILIRLETDLVDICNAMLADDPAAANRGDNSLSKMNISWKPGNSACVVLASAGYPAAPKTGDVITGLDEAGSVDGITVFHAGTRFENADDKDAIVTAGGRVLGVTSTGRDLSAALARAYDGAAKIHFEGAQMRRDIGK